MGKPGKNLEGNTCVLFYDLPYVIAGTENMSKDVATEPSTTFRSRRANNSTTTIENCLSQTYRSGKTQCDTCIVGGCTVITVTGMRQRREEGRMWTIEKFNKLQRQKATGYELHGPGIESRWGEIFRTCPDRPWGPPKLL